MHDPLRQQYKMRNMDLGAGKRRWRSLLRKRGSCNIPVRPSRLCCWCQTHRSYNDEFLYNLELLHDEQHHAIFGLERALTYPDNIYT